MQHYWVWHYWICGHWEYWLWRVAPFLFLFYKSAFLKFKKKVLSSITLLGSSFHTCATLCVYNLHPGVLYKPFPSRLQRNGCISDCMGHNGHYRSQKWLHWELITMTTLSSVNRLQATFCSLLPPALSLKLTFINSFSILTKSPWFQMLTIFLFPQVLLDLPPLSIFSLLHVSNA